MLRRRGGRRSLSTVRDQRVASAGPLLWLAAATLLYGVGCAGQAPSPSPLFDEFDRYAEDVRQLEPSVEVREVLGVGQKRRDSAEAIAANGKPKRSIPVAEAAISDVRVALATAQLEIAQRRADSCRREVEQTRQGWEEAFHILEQTESIVSRVAPLSRQSPSMEDHAGLPLPESTILHSTPQAMTAGEIRSAWDDWSRAAGPRMVSLADLEGEFRGYLARGTDPEAKEEAREHYLHRASRVIQEAECRVRIDAGNRVCVRAATLSTQLAQGRDDALRATLELERGLQDDLRSELDKARTDARTRQDELYSALGQIEGRFAQISQDARGTILSLADILFDFDKATLKREVEFALVKIATILGQFPEMGILVEGHTDNVGSETYNLELSQRRAEAVHDFLESQGIDAGRMAFQGYGMSRPVTENSTEEGRQKNRRVDLIIQDS